MVVLQYMSDIVGNVLVDQDNTDIIPRCEGLKCFFDLLQFGVLLDNQEIGSLGGSVSDSCQQESRDRVLSNGCGNEISG